MKETGSWQSRTRNKTRELTYLEAVAASLVKYASGSSRFAGELKSLCRYIETDHGTGRQKEVGVGEWLAPDTDELAAARAVWLISRINEGGAGSEAAAQSLLKWERNYPYEAPRQVVVGIAATTIPGITVGRVSKRRVMTLVVETGSSRSDAAELSRLAVSASQGVVSRALERAGGEVDKLDPDVAMWMYEDRELKFYQAEQKELARIKKDLDKAGVVNELLSKEGEPLALALSPAVNPEAEGVTWNLRSLNSR